MKVIAKRKVDIYQKQPYQIPDNEKGQLYPNFEIEVEEVTGEDIDGNNIWYRDKNGDFYWSGLMDVINSSNEEAMEDTNEQLTPWNNLFDYRQLVKLIGNLGDKYGEGINIAILDSGVFVNHSDFDENKITFPGIYNSFDEILDRYGHGTHITGIICGQSKDESGIIGVAPNSSIEHFKVLNDNGITNFEKLKSSLRYILENHEGYDIINMSFSITNDEFNQIQETLNEIKEKGIIMVAAAGNDDYLFDRVYFPAFSEYIISVGAIIYDYFDDFKTKGFYERVDFIYLNEEIYSSFIEPEIYENKGGCSVFAALTSGIISNIISSENIEKTQRFARVKQRLEHMAFSFQNANNLEKYKLYKT